VYRNAAAISLPRTARSIWTDGRAIQDAQPGDIIVFDTVGGAASHVAILLDDNTIIHAVSQGPRTGVIISPVTDRYFSPRVMGMRTFISQAVPAAPAVQAETLPPERSPQAAVEAEAVDYLALTISARPEISSDRIPIARGSTLRFAITNETGRDEIFELLFYKVDMDPGKNVTLMSGRMSIRNHQMLETSTVTFLDEGQYRFIIKSRDNRKLVERTWRVIPAQ
jgi:hypothetical protein